MKKLQILLALVMAAPIIAAGPMVLAEGTATSPPATSGTTAKPTETDPEKEIAKLIEAEKAKGTQADRIKLRIADLKIKLTAAEIAKLKIKCVVAQGQVKVLDARVDKGITARSKAYDELLGHVDGLIAKLKVAKVSTTDLEAQRTVLKTKIDTFKADLVKYKVALSDAESLGCLADPTGFKAALEAARAARVVVAGDALAVRTYMTGTIKPTLKAIRDSLEKTTTSTDKPTTTDKATTTPDKPSTDKPTTTTGGTQ